MAASMYDALSSLEPFDGPCSRVRLTVELDGHVLRMLDRLCRHYNMTRDQAVDMALEKDYLSVHDWGCPERDDWDIRVLEQAARVVALWHAGRLRTYTYVASGRGGGRVYERKALEPGVPGPAPRVTTITLGG
jgi:hypothetical protein